MANIKKLNNREFRITIDNKIFGHYSFTYNPYIGEFTKFKLINQAEDMYNEISALSTFNFWSNTQIKLCDMIHKKYPFTLVQNLCLINNQQGGTIHQFIDIKDYDKLNDYYIERNEFLLKNDFINIEAKLNIKINLI